MPDPNAKMMPPEDLSPFMASLPRVTFEQMAAASEAEFRKRLELLRSDPGAAARAAGVPVTSVLETIAECDS